MSLRENYLALMAILGWFALIAQFVLILQNRTTDLGETIVRYFSFFTILINILVAIFVTSQLSGGASKSATYFSRPTVQTAATLYITVVGLVYNLILRQLWEVHGLQKIVDELLHTIIPLLAVFYWWKWVNGRELTFGNIPAWLIFPALYAIYTLWRGTIAGYYPYPFLNVVQLGYPKVLINSAGLVGVFLLFSFLFIIVGRKKS